MNDLRRFRCAQEHDRAYERAVGELRAGRKRGHWMWFIFPQVAGLGDSAMSRRFGIRGLDEARAYLEHPVLGTRLVLCAEIVNGLGADTAEEVFGAVDATKLRSSMTLFLRARPAEAIFAGVLQHYFDGRPDEATDALLRD